jgi:hypothetical protein
MAFKALLGLIMTPSGQLFLRRITLTPDPGDSKTLDKLIALTWTCRARGETAAVSMHFTALSARAILATPSEDDGLARMILRALDELGLPPTPLGDGFSVRPRLGCLIRLGSMGRAQEVLRLCRLWAPRVEGEVDRPLTVFAFLKTYTGAAVQLAGKRVPSRSVLPLATRLTQERAGLSRISTSLSEASRTHTTLRQSSPCPPPNETWQPGGASRARGPDLGGPGGGVPCRRHRRSSGSRAP